MERSSFVPSVLVLTPHSSPVTANTSYILHWEIDSSTLTRVYTGTEHINRLYDVACFLRFAQQYRSGCGQNHGQSALQRGHYLQERLFSQSSISLYSLLFTSKNEYTYRQATCVRHLHHLISTAQRSGSKLHHQHKLAALVCRIHWLHLFTVGEVKTLCLYLCQCSNLVKYRLSPVLNSSSHCTIEADLLQPVFLLICLILPLMLSQFPL